MDLAVVIVVVMVLLFVGSFVLGMTVGVPGAVKEPRQPKVAAELAAAGSAVATRRRTTVRDPNEIPGVPFGVLLGILAIALIVLAVSAVVIGLPLRAAFAADRQLSDNVNNGARLYASTCVKCHGSTGQGVVGPSLHLSDFAGRNKLNPANPADLQKLRDLATTTITHGRAGTVMPAWGRDDGGPLSDSQISNLVDLIATDGWAAVAAVPAAPVAAAVPTPAVPAAGGPPGVALIAKYGCGGCHTISAIPGAVGTVGPNLSKEGANPKVPMSTGAMDNNPANLAKWIFNAPSIKPGIAMPNFSAQGMTQADADTIAAYLETLK